MACLTLPHRRSLPPGHSRRAVIPMPALLMPRPLTFRGRPTGAAYPQPTPHRHQRPRGGAKPPRPGRGVHASSHQPRPACRAQSITQEPRSAPTAPFHVKHGETTFSPSPDDRTMTHQLPGRLHTTTRQNPTGRPTKSDRHPKPPVSSRSHEHPRSSWCSPPHPVPTCGGEGNPRRGRAPLSRSSTTDIRRRARNLDPTPESTTASRPEPRPRVQRGSQADPCARRPRIHTPRTPATPRRTRSHPRAAELAHSDRRWRHTNSVQRPPLSAPERSRELRGIR